MDLSELADTLIERFTNPPPVVTVLRLSGLIMAGGGLLRGGLNLANLAAPLAAAFRPKRLAAVALTVNSPGGSPVQSALIGNRIRALAEERSVPVVAFVEDLAASGGYWLAAAADEIFADPASILGSIGVVSAGFGLDEAIRRLGISRRLHTAGARKRMLDPFLPEKPEDVARLKILQEEIHDTFKAWVRLRRQGRLAAPEDDLFNGDVWTGRRAVELGLADGLGDLRTVMRARFGDKVRLVAVGERRAWWRPRLFRSEELPAGLLAAIEERLSWARWGL